jgi:hypothetical protein
VTYTSNNPGSFPVIVGCTVTWTITNTTDNTTSTVSASGSAKTTVNIGVLWSPNSITGGVLVQPQNQTMNPPTPQVVILNDGTGGVQCSVTDAAATDTWTLGSNTSTASDSVSYSWTCDQGSFDNPSSQSAHWTPPAASGNGGQPQSGYTANITCTISAIPGPIGPYDGGKRGPQSISSSVTLYLMGQVTVTGQKPSDVYATIPADGSAAATVSPSVPGTTEVCDWSTANIYYAAPTKKGQPEVFAPATDGSTVVWNGDSANESYTATFNSVGHYIIEASCTVKLEDNAGNVLWSGTGTGYIGGTQADVDGSNSSNAGIPNATVPPLLGTNDASSEDDTLESSDSTPGASGKPGIPVKPLLRIKCDGNFITNNHKPFRVIRGKKVTLTVVIAPGLTISSGAWSSTQRLTRKGTPIQPEGK